MREILGNGVFWLYSFNLEIDCCRNNGRILSARCFYIKLLLNCSSIQKNSPQRNPQKFLFSQICKFTTKIFLAHNFFVHFAQKNSKISKNFVNR